MGNETETTELKEAPEQQVHTSDLLSGAVVDQNSYDHELIECPECGKDHFFDNEDLPDRACDGDDFTCDYCNTKLKLGWYATAELTRA
ncbi:MAG: hypothetical protein OEL79_04700 [Chromatiales bacterium]|nr:hypothetical protein [Chromatiales bacterium]